MAASAVPPARPPPCGAPCSRCTAGRDSRVDGKETLALGYRPGRRQGGEHREPQLRGEPQLLTAELPPVSGCGSWCPPQDQVRALRVWGPSAPLPRLGSGRPLPPPAWEAARLEARLSLSILETGRAPFLTETLIAEAMSCYRCWRWCRRAVTFAGDASQRCCSQRGQRGASSLSPEAEVSQSLPGTMADFVQTFIFYLMFQGPSVELETLCCF